MHPSFHIQGVQCAGTKSDSRSAKYTAQQHYWHISKRITGQRRQRHHPGNHPHPFSAPQVSGNSAGHFQRHYRDKVQADCQRKQRQAQPSRKKYQGVDASSQSQRKPRHAETCQICPRMQGSSGCFTHFYRLHSALAAFLLYLPPQWDNGKRSFQNSLFLHLGVYERQEMSVYNWKIPAFPPAYCIRPPD